MTIGIKTNTCKASPDFELSMGWDRKISYHMALPSKKSKGIIFFISCFGLEFSYIENWLKKAADKFDMHAVSVEYHCYQSRPETGAQVQITREFELKIKGLCKELGIENDTVNNQTLTEIGKRLPAPVQFNDVILMPPNGDYQNFGLMQAIDHLCVIADLINRKIKTDFSNIVLFGSSHGGYIAHMISKLAPNTVRLIIDNSSYVTPPPNYLGLGCEYTMSFGNLFLGCSVFRHWQHERQYEENYYGISKKMIRDTANQDHLDEIYPDGNVKVIAYNLAENDFISFPAYKKHQQQAYLNAGFDYELNLIEQGHLGDTFKTLSHGMDASLWDLACLNEFEIMNYKGSDSKIDYLQKTRLYFDCYNAQYIIKHNHKDFPVHIEIIKERNV